MKIHNLSLREFMKYYVNICSSKSLFKSYVKIVYPDKMAKTEEWKKKKS